MIMGKAASVEAELAACASPPDLQDRASVLLRAAGIWSPIVESGLTKTQKELASSAVLQVRDELSVSDIEFGDGAGDRDIVETTEGVRDMAEKFGAATIRQVVCEKFLVLPEAWADASYRQHPHLLISLPESLRHAGETVIFDIDQAQVELHGDAYGLVSFIEKHLEGVDEARQTVVLERSLACVSAKAALIVTSLLNGGSIDEIRKYTGYTRLFVDEGLNEFKDLFKLMLSGGFDPIRYFNSFTKLPTEAYNPLYLASVVGVQVGDTERLQSVSDRLLGWLKVQPFDEKTRGTIVEVCGLNANVHLPMRAICRKYEVGYNSIRPLISRLGDYGPAVAREILDAYAAARDGEFDYRGGNCLSADPDELFVPGTLQNIAKLICDDCPVRARCLAFALTREIGYGVWGGNTERERRARIRKTEDMEQWAKHVLQAVGYELAV